MDMLMYGNEMLFAHAIVSLWKQGEAVNPLKRERLQCVKNVSARKWMICFVHDQNTTSCQWGHGYVSWSGLPSKNIMWDSYGFVILCFKLTLLLQIIYLSKKPSLKKGPKILPTPPNSHSLNVGFKAANSSIQWRRRGRVPSWSCLWIRTLSSVICSQH